jgi:hypothetical protein
MPFLMGSPVSEHDRSDVEIQYEVTLTRGFWLALGPEPGQAGEAGRERGRTVRARSER